MTRQEVIDKALTIADKCTVGRIARALDKDEELVCPLCGGQVLWMPVSHIYVCEHCKQSYSEMNGVYLRKERKATAEKSSAVSDAAKLREALVTISKVSDDYRLKTTPGALDRIYELAQAALAAPPRNCDRPECATTKAAQDVWRREDGGKTAYYEWLLAPAAEKEGGSNGN